MPQDRYVKILSPILCNIKINIDQKLQCNLLKVSLTLNYFSFTLVGGVSVGAVYWSGLTPGPFSKPLQAVYIVSWGWLYWCVTHVCYNNMHACTLHSSRLNPNKAFAGWRVIDLPKASSTVHRYITMEFIIQCPHHRGYPMLKYGVSREPIVSQTVQISCQMWEQLNTDKQAVTWVEVMHAGNASLSILKFQSRFVRFSGRVYIHVTWLGKYEWDGVMQGRYILYTEMNNKWKLQILYISRA